MQKGQYAVCEELIHGELSGRYTVQHYKDCNPWRFIVRRYFDNYEEANDFCKKLRAQSRHYVS